MANLYNQRAFPITDTALRWLELNLAEREGGTAVRVEPFARIEPLRGDAPSASILLAHRLLESCNAHPRPAQRA